MNISEVLGRIKVREIDGSLTRTANGVTYDSRKVQPGNMFFAIKGEHSDGHNYIADAVKNGASSVIYEDDISIEPYSGKDVLFVRVEDVRLALGYISANHYGDPSTHLNLTGITGTNGKTSTSYILKSILEANAKDVGLIGTVAYMIKDKVHTAGHTTPESPEFQMYLSEMYKAGCTHVVTEVSSHALSQRRVDGVEFDTAVFTNLTRDHLDYHKDMNDYYNAKMRLFTELVKPTGTAIINTDDPYGRRLFTQHSGQMITYGLNADADVRATDINLSMSGLEFTVSSDGKYYKTASNLRGLINVYNILAAFSTALSLGIPFNDILAGIYNLKIVTGRFEPIDEGQDFNVIIDYAHTDDALKNLLENVRKIVPGKIITVFGCGGNRDKGKRPIMGAVATSLSDFAIITSDNPRYEEPLDIIKQIEEGAGEGYSVEPDRAKAIRDAIYMAGAGDAVVIAGKGHEPYQEIKGVQHPFSDKETASKILKKLLKEKD
ncbi:MAG: UDP-N-acetylmuramoyl-L-alanyl-D-glutamate--2,6-diaminopimelate ligase [Nitrospirae bacterium]|nr:UDP-N-acetylmuramoyl-L-alanyl-D-glutamate--2,6-diaminopimelate ligase [Nitrospirota bacterium]